MKNIKIKRNHLLFILLIITTIFFFGILTQITNFKTDTNKFVQQVKNFPNDWMFSQRAFPTGTINQTSYINSLKFKKELIDRKNSNNTGNNNIWEFCGPTNIGGRVTDVEMPASHMETIYIGAASGGIFKSTDSGISWTAVFDDALSLSVGDIAIAPSNENILYAGTGEANAGGGSVAYDGVGVYKSTDAGNSWTFSGLENVGSIGKVVVDSDNPDILYVAAMGHLFEKNNERGIYKSSDGGANWDQVLFISDSTGAIDMAINPQDPNIIYAAMWERTRRPDRRSYGGITSGIYKTIDGGDNWFELTVGLPTLAEEKGRIGISISQSSPNILYATYADQYGNLQGIFKTDDSGDTWIEKNNSGINSTPYEWWFSKIVIDPNNENTIYFPGFNIHKTSDDCENWIEVFEGTHVDQHALFVHPLNSEFLVLGNDGGVYFSDDGGATMTKFNNLPITQFYTCEIDYLYPERLYGGTQDNSTMRTMTGNTDDWDIIYYGDGFYTLVNPIDNNHVYTEYQYGNFARSTNGGNSFVSAMNGISGQDRKNWNTPVVFDPNNPSTLFYGANRLYKSVNKAVSWTAISPDLSNGAGTGNLTYGTITTISVSSQDANVIYAGTDDGNVWITQNGGTEWTNISSSLPERWVTRVAADPFDANVAYVTFSGYRYGSYLAHIYKTNDFGENWTDISGNLPDIPVNDIVIDPENSNLYIATDIGVFYSENSGDSWDILGLELPTVVITDITYHNRTKILVAATYGRSMYKYVFETINTEDLNLSKNVINIFPNPVSSNAVIQFENKNTQFYSIDIYDIKGNIVRNIFAGNLQIGQYKFKLNSAGLNSAIYFCRISNKNKQTVVSHKIIIAK